MGPDFEPHPGVTDPSLVLARRDHHVVATGPASKPASSVPSLRCVHQPDGSIIFTCLAQIVSLLYGLLRPHPGLDPDLLNTVVLIHVQKAGRALERVLSAGLDTTSSAFSVTLRSLTTAARAFTILLASSDWSQRPGSGCHFFFPPAAKAAMQRMNEELITPSAAPEDSEVADADRAARELCPLVDSVEFLHDGAILHLPFLWGSSAAPEDSEVADADDEDEV